MIEELPQKYKWLEDEKAPRILMEMLNLFGVYEYAGKEDNPIILEWAKEIHQFVGMDYLHDSTAWCGLIMGVCAHRAGYTPPHICVRAKEWKIFGWESDMPMLGDVLVFDRSGGGHVGLYIAEDEDCYHVLGGNQSDQVKISRMYKNRLINSRRCPWRIGKPDSVRQIFMDNNGIISHNEA